MLENSLAADLALVVITLKPRCMLEKSLAADLVLVLDIELRILLRRMFH